MTHASCRSFVHNALKQHKHLVGAVRAYHLVHARLKFSNHVALVVFYSRHEQRCCSYAVVHERRVCAHHLAHRHVAWAKTQRHGGVDVGVTDAIVVKQADKLLRTELAHEISRNPVVRLCQSPFQRHHLPVSSS